MFIYCRYWGADNIMENRVLSSHSETTICWCFLERLHTVWRYLNYYLVWGTIQLCYYIASVIICTDYAWVEMEGLICYTLIGNIYSPIGAENLYERKLRKQITAFCVCHLKTWLYLETDQQLASLKKIPYLNFAYKRSFGSASSLDKSKRKESKNKNWPTCLLIVF